MSVKFELEHDVQTVYATLTDPQFLVDRSDALGENNAECEVEEDEDSTTVRLVREIHRDLPKLLAKFFEATQVTEMTEEWLPDGDGWSGRWRLEVRGQPILVEADFQLQPTARGSRYTVSHRAKAKIPVVGRQIEKFILGQAVDGVKNELAYLKDYLQ